MTEKIQEILESFMREIEDCTSSHQIMLLKNKYIGDTSELKQMLKSLKNMSIDEKKTFGPVIQKAFDHIEKTREKPKKQEKINPLLFTYQQNNGMKHIIPQTINEIKTILIKMGFIFSDGPEIESTFRNFEALNVNEKHPCRTDHQSFFVNSSTILRTHTSSVQTYVIEQLESTIKSFTIGRTYRRDLDATHVPMFHQIEGIYIAPTANLSEMFKVIKTLLSNWFEIDNPEIRVRPSYFPFTEPSYEIDIKLEGKWLEILGCGMIHRNVFTALGQAPKIGFAFGCGLERMAMVKYKINDLRAFYTHNLSNLISKNQ